MRSLLILQYGDYAKTFDRFAAGGTETFRDQRRSVDFVRSLAPGIKVTVAVFCGAVYERELAPNLVAIGLRDARLSRAEVRELFDRSAATLVVLVTPHLRALHEANRRGVPVLPSFADIFAPGRLRGRLNNWRMSKALAAPNVVCAANHSLNASRSLVSVIGLPASRVVPWDWSRLPLAGAAKSGPAEAGRLRLFYAGTLLASKGVGDCLMAVQKLRQQGREVKIDFAGSGDAAPWQAEAEQLGISGAVRFLGLLPNSEVRAEMRAHDIVVVPSRHDYAEGLPNTIYEALASRSPLVISDHPAFAGRLSERECVVFRAADGVDLAAKIASIQDDPELYRDLSEHAEAGLEGLYVGIEWTEMVRLFLEDPFNATGWVEAHSLAALDRGDTLPGTPEKHC